MKGKRHCSIFIAVYVVLGSVLDWKPMVLIEFCIDSLQLANILLILTSL
jgi:hypothetical protein